MCTLGEKEELQVPENFGSAHHQTNGDERKSKKRETADKRVSFSKPKSAAGISSKE